MLRLAAGIIGGLAVAFTLVFATDSLFHALAPPPRSSDVEAIARHVAAQPVGLLLLMVAGWALAVFVGSALAARFCWRGAWPGYVVTGLFLLASASNFATIRHPSWMVAASVALILAGGRLGSALAARPGRDTVRAGV